MCIRDRLITAPFDAETLFGRKPITAVVEESHNERVNRAITTLSTSHSRGASSQKRGRSGTKPHEAKLSLLSKTSSLTKGKEVPHLVGVPILVVALPEEGAAEEGSPPNEMSRPITPNPKETSHNRAISR